MRPDPTSKEQARTVPSTCPACGGDIEPHKVVGYQCKGCGRVFHMKHGRLYELKGEDHETG